MTKLNCKLCQEAGEKISNRHRDPRRCGFDEEGVFDHSNYCCATLWALVEKIDAEAENGRMAYAKTYGDDEWSYLYQLPEHIDHGAGLVIGVLLQQYKGRGKIQGAWMLFDNGTPPAPLTTEIATEILNLFDK